MKKSTFLPFLLISFLLFSLSNCKNEDILIVEEEDQIEQINIIANTRDREVAECRSVPEFCKPVSNIIGSIEGDSKEEILVHVGNEIFQVSPINLLENSRNLLIRKGDDLFVLSTNESIENISNSSDYQLLCSYLTYFLLILKK